MSRTRQLLLGAMLLTLATPVRAVYEPFRLKDPSRRWAVSLNVRGEYDDNIFTASTNTQSSYKTTVEPQVLVNVPLEQTFIGLRYSYGVTHFTDRSGDSLDKFHAADFLFSHTFTPRLVLDLQDQLRIGQEPEVVQLQGSIPVTLRRRGDFVFNSLTGTLSYNMTRRWIVAIGGYWEHWRFDDELVAEGNDRDLFHTTLSASYAIDPRTFIGANYRYQRTTFDKALSTLRDSESHIPFLSWLRRFSPKLSLQLSAGAELREFDDGKQDTSPFAGIGVSYNYAREGVVTAGFRYVTTETDEGVIGSFRSVESAILFLNANHRFTRKLRGTIEALYALNSFENPVGIPVGSAEEDLIRLFFRLTYAFTHWCDAELSYAFDRVDSDFSVRSFERNRVSAGLRLTY